MVEVGVAIALLVEAEHHVEHQQKHEDGDGDDDEVHEVVDFVDLARDRRRGLLQPHLARGRLTHAVCRERRRKRALPGGEPCKCRARRPAKQSFQHPSAPRFLPRLVCRAAPQSPSCDLAGLRRRCPGEDKLAVSSTSHARNNFEAAARQTPPNNKQHNRHSRLKSSFVRQIFALNLLSRCAAFKCASRGMQSRSARSENPGHFASRSHFSLFPRRDDRSGRPEACVHEEQSVVANAHRLKPLRPRRRAHASTNSRLLDVPSRALLQRNSARSWRPP